MADLFAAADRDADGETVLDAARARNQQSADVENALGLVRIRRKELPGALVHLQHAATLRPEDARYAYVDAVALYESGDAAGAARWRKRLGGRDVPGWTPERRRGQCTPACAPGGSSGMKVPSSTMPFSTE